MNIDFVIPVLNENKSILKCVDSIKSLKNYSDESCKILIIDNGSTDGTQKTLENQGIPFHTCIKKGRSSARNYGLALSSAKYIAFVDADVELGLNWLNLINVIEKCKLFCGGQCSVFPIQDNTFLTNFRNKRKLMVKGLEFYSSKYSLPIINTAACIYKKDLISILLEGLMSL